MKQPRVIVVTCGNNLDFYQSNVHWHVTESGALNVVQGARTIASYSRTGYKKVYLEKSIT